MFSRNEKYGQALHLQYGSFASTPKKAVSVKRTLAAKLISIFWQKDETPTITGRNAALEMTFDKAFIDQAVHSELKNTDAAANENAAVKLNEIA